MCDGALCCDVVQIWFQNKRSKMKKTAPGVLEEVKKRIQAERHMRQQAVRIGVQQPAEARVLCAGWENL